MTTARDIVKDMLRKIHVLGKGASLDPEEANDALNLLNDMLAVWSVRGDMVYTETKETFNLTSGVRSYTIGPGADFDTTRPLYFKAINVTQGGIDYRLKQVDASYYASIPQKDIDSTPLVFYYDAGYPNGTIYLHPGPGGGYTITLYSFKTLTSFTSLDTVYNMPEEYKAAIIYNGAVWIAPEYEKEASNSIKQIAHETKEAISAQNKRNEFFASILDVPGQRGAHGNIYGGYFN